MAASPFLTGDETEFEGQAGWAKRVTFPDDIPVNAGIVQWLFFAPGAHPMWAYHVLYVVHLRDIEGQPPANKDFPEATHEFGVLAINPEYPSDTVERYIRSIRVSGGGIYLTPHDSCTQLSCSDEQAKRIAAYAARAVALGALVPDSDFARAWDRALKDTLQHEQTGGHG